MKETGDRRQETGGEALVPNTAAGRCQRIFSYLLSPDSYLLPGRFA
jgi:hypothetical protein